MRSWIASMASSAGRGAVMPHRPLRLRIGDITVSACASRLVDWRRPRGEEHASSSPPASRAAALVQRGHSTTPTRRKDTR